MSAPDHKVADARRLMDAADLLLKATGARGVFAALTFVTARRNAVSLAYATTGAIAAEELVGIAANAMMQAGEISGLGDAALLGKLAEAINDSRIRKLIDEKPREAYRQ